MRHAICGSLLLVTTPFAALATPSMVGKWSCENYDENNSLQGVVTYFDDSTSEGSFNMNALQGDTTISIFGVYRADWEQNGTALTETITWVDIQELTVNGQDYGKTSTENEMEQSMIAAGSTHSEIIDSSEVEVVLEDAEGNVSTCRLF